LTILRRIYFNRKPLKGLWQKYRNMQLLKTQKSVEILKYSRINLLVFKRK